MVTAQAQTFRPFQTNPIKLESGQNARIDISLAVGDDRERRSHRRQPDSSDAECGRRRSYLPDDDRADAAQRPQLLPARASAARRHDDGARHVHRAEELRAGAPLRQRPARAGKQLHARRHGHERGDRQPAAISAEPGRAAGGTGRHEQLLRRVRQRRRRAGRTAPSSRARTNSTATRSSTTEAAAWPRTRGTTIAGTQQRRICRSTSSARPSAARSSRTSCSSSATTRGSCGIARASRWSASRRPRGGRATSRASDVAPLVIRDPVTGLPFPGNQIPQNRFSPVAKSILANQQLYPLPTLPGASNNLVTGSSDKQHAHQGDVKVDANLSTNDHIFGRFSYQNYKSEPERRGAREPADRDQRLAVHGPRHQLEPCHLTHVGQRVPLRVYPGEIPDDPARLGGNRRRERERGHSRRAGDPRPEQLQHQRRGRLRRLWHRRVQRHQELSVHRQVLDVPRAALAEVRRPLAVPAAGILLLRQRGDSRPLRLHRRLHRLRVRRFPAG